MSRCGSTPLIDPPPCCRCHHGPQSKCVNCMPLQPWDKAVQEGRDDTTIKHLSFHTHIRKLTSGVDRCVYYSHTSCVPILLQHNYLLCIYIYRGKFANLEDLSCKIKPGCKDHSPWPAGICTKCQPSAITLARQVL